MKARFGMAVVLLAITLFLPWTSVTKAAPPPGIHGQGSTGPGGYDLTMDAVLTPNGSAHGQATLVGGATGPVVQVVPPKQVCKSVARFSQCDAAGGLDHDSSASDSGAATGTAAREPAGGGPGGLAGAYGP